MASICGNVSKFAAKNKKKYSMRRFFHAMLVVLTGAMAMTSCLGSGSNEYTVYDNVALTSFTLGTLNVYGHTPASDGTDSVYKITYVGSTFGMSIDQVNHRIFNHDSLPKGTDLKHVVCTLTTKTTSIVMFKDINSDLLLPYNQTDSIDFSVPRELRVYPTDGTAYRAYTVTLSAQQEDDDVFSWKEKPVASFPGRPAVNLDSVASVVAADLRAYAQDGATVEDELPVKALGYVKWPLSANASYELLAGTAAAPNGCLSLWRKVTYQGRESKWIYMPYSSDNAFRLPLMDRVTLAYHNNAVLAVGNGTIYTSFDQGIAWTESSLNELPEDADASAIDAVVAADGSLWLTDGQKTWQAVLKN